MPAPVPQNITPLPTPAEFDEWGSKLNKAIEDRTSAPYVESQLPARLDQTELDARYSGGSGGTPVPGDDGKSAYEVWLDEGNTGTVAQYLASLKGADGEDGTDGADGPGVFAYATFADAPALPAGSVVISISGN